MKKTFAHELRANTTFMSLSIMESERNGKFQIDGLSGCKILITSVFIMLLSPVARFTNKLMFCCFLVINIKILHNCEYLNNCQVITQGKTSAIKLCHLFRTDL